MAEHLNVGALSLSDSQHAPMGVKGNGPSTYIPPHMRGHQAGPPPGLNGPPPQAMNGSAGGGAWEGPARYALGSLNSGESFILITG